MHGLIRPALFWVARIGLVLSFAAWAVCHFWTLTITVSGHSIAATRWTIERTNIRSVGSWLDVTPSDSPEMAEWQLTKGMMGKVYGNTVRRYPGVYSASGKTGYVFTVCHWLIVTVFALFYAVLKWVYRKRPAESGFDA